jgi:hypothetical protein
MRLIKNTSILAGVISILLQCCNANAAMRDPTQPANYVGDAGGNPWQLNATIISSDRRVAVINETSVQIGDSINGQRVTAINPGVVKLVGDDGEMILQLIDQPIKRMPSVHK